jgi:tripartite-type tricarboxylate transporter receptor subunit TctC
MEKIRMAISPSCIRPLILVSLIVQCTAYSRAADYPTKVIRYVVPASSGSTSDILGRIIAERLGAIFGQQVIVDNRPGAGNNIGAEIAAKAPPDGYTLLQAATSHVVNISLYSRLAYDLVRDFAPVTHLASVPAVIVIHPSLPARSVDELVQLAKRNPGQVRYASAGVGTSTFLAPEFFKKQTGIDMLHVPYRGASGAITAVMSGETSVYFSPVAPVLPLIREGRLRALAVTSGTRLPMLAEYPTIAEAGYPGFQATNWYGLMVPAKTPKARIAALHDAVMAVLDNADVSKRLGDLGFVTIGSTPDEFAARVKSDIESLGKIMRELRVTPQ